MIKRQHTKKAHAPLSQRHMDSFFPNYSYKSQVFVDSRMLT